MKTFSAILLASAAFLTSPVHAGQLDANGCESCARGAVLLDSPQYAAQYALAHDAFAAELKDPYSVVFGGLVARVISPGVAKICTSVNAKNSFGGYVGVRWAMGTLTPSGFTVGLMSSSDHEDVVIYEDCVRHGVIKASE